MAFSRMLRARANSYKQISILLFEKYEIQSTERYNTKINRIIVESLCTTHLKKVYIYLFHSIAF